MTTSLFRNHVPILGVSGQAAFAESRLDDDRSLCWVPFFAISTPVSTHAQELIESYSALLSEADHFNSNGQRLRVRLR
jgi:hypothetical protein